MNKLGLALVSFCFVALVSAVPIEEQGGKRLIKTSETEPAKWLTEAEITALVDKDIGFMDITDLRLFSERAPQVSSSKGVPTALQYQTLVNDAFTHINLTRIESFIDNFSRFFNRYYDSQLGVASEKWLLGEVYDSVRGYTGAVTIREFQHNFLQYSIIARLEGSDPDLNTEVVIVGAHQDSINGAGSDLRAPGADDNASGSITVLEALRSIVASGIIPQRSMEFHWYAGEERGLLGSLDIAESYRQEGVNVTGMMNFDVVGYYIEGNDEVAVITDYVDDELTEFLRLVIDGYLENGRTERPCGYACSDHAAWTQYGFPAVRPTQTVRNPQMHTVTDTIETVSFTYVREFVKVAIGFLVELAEPTDNSSM